MNIGEAGIALIKEFEGRRLAVYCDPIGILTVGYGHTGPDLEEGSIITEVEADAYLREDVAHAEKCVNRLTNGIQITQGQFDALVSFVFNLGCDALRRSTLLVNLLDGDDASAAKEFVRWNRAGGKVLAGLTRRREAEAALFRT